MKSSVLLRLCSLACVATLAIACGQPSPVADGAVDTAGSSSSGWVPPPDASIPRRPYKLAKKINRNEVRLVRDLKRWRRDGAERGSELVAEIKLRALFQQRATGVLVRGGRLYNRVLWRLKPVAKWFYKANVRAGRNLSHLSGTPPKKPPKMRYERSEAPNDLKRYYEAGKKRFDVPVNILASVNFVETKFGRILGPSSAGAVGPMQFLPSTWDAYGMGGNVWDPHDAILGAANYLSASGAPERMYDALHAYNPSDAYVRTVQEYARQMRRHPFRYYDYYWWQVFIRTQDGVIQMTGPGTSRPNY